MKHLIYFLGIVFLFIIALLWVPFWYKISNGQPWGLLCALSPVIVCFLRFVWVYIGEELL